MKSVFTYFLSAIILFTITTACSDSFLEVEPYGSLSGSVVEDEKGVDNLLIGAYAYLANGHYQMSPLFLRGADDTRYGTNSGVGENDAYLYTVNVGNARWNRQYAAIKRCNEVLRVLQKVDEIAPEKRTQIEAETRFLRAHFYHELVMFFRNVPWIDETITYESRNFYVSNTIDVFPFIEADLEFAGNNLTETKPEVGRINKWAAKSMLAKVYMFQKKFQEAKPLLDDIIANGQTSNGKKYELQEEYNLNFIQRWKHSGEAVFTAQMRVSSLTSGKGNPFDRANGTYNAPPSLGWGWISPTFDLVDAFQTDPDTGLPLLDTYQETPVAHDNGIASSEPFTPHQGTLDSRLDWCVGRRGIPYRDWGVHPGKGWVRNQDNGGPYQVVKNIAEQATVDTDRRGAYTNNPLNIIRFADVLLWAAECEVEVGSLSKAEELVNTVRARASNPDGFVKKYINPDDPLTGFSDEPAANYKVGLYDGHFEANGKSYARKAVRFERRLEFACEHHRFFDLVRYDGNDYDIVEGINGFLEREAPRITNTNNAYKSGEFVRNKHEFFPIPQTQIDLSVVDGESVLVQNPGWD